MTDTAREDCSNCLHSTQSLESDTCQVCEYDEERNTFSGWQPEPMSLLPKPRRSLDDATPQEWQAAAQDLGKERRVDVSKPASPLDVQVAGAHYKSKAIQPVEYISANGLNFLEGCIVKRITRWRDKKAADRFQDLEKIKHEVDLLIAMEKRYGR